MSYEDLINEHEQNTQSRWTESEMEDWIRNLPERKKNLFLTSLKKGMGRGTNAHSLACRLRVAAENAEAQAEASQPSRFWSMVNFYADASRGWAEGKMIHDYHNGGLKVQVTNKE